MNDFYPGDKVQIDPALVNGGVRRSKGVGTVTARLAGGTKSYVMWPKDHGGPEVDVKSMDLVLVSRAEGGSQ